MPDLGDAREKTVFVSGIGCSSRFPYYMASYGFHTIHGRAARWRPGPSSPIPNSTCGSSPATATRSASAAITRCTCLRRNLDCQLLLFNNEIYGLTKGQYSPTSRIGTRSPSTPFGSVDRPARPCAFALGSGARFVARGIDVHKNLVDVLKAAHAHRGASFVEIFQNCVVYNDDVFAPFTDKSVAADKQLWLVAGEKMLFAGGAKGIALDRDLLALKVVDGDSDEVIVHDPEESQRGAHAGRNAGSEFPGRAWRALRRSRPTFDSAVIEQNVAAATGKSPDLQKLVSQGQTWQVEKEPRAE